MLKYRLQYYSIISLNTGGLFNDKLDLVYEQSFSFYFIEISILPIKPHFDTYPGLIDYVPTPPPPTSLLGPSVYSGPKSNL